VAFPTVDGAVTSTTDPASTSHTITLPTGIVAGDLLIAMIITDKASNAHIWPSGWNEIADLVDGDDTSAMSVAWRDAAGGDADPVVTSDVSGKSFQQAYRISGAEAGSTQPPQVATMAQDGAAPDPPSNTPTGGAKDYLWIAGYGGTSGGTNLASAAPTNYTNLLAQNVADGEGFINKATARRNLNTATENPGTFTLPTPNDTIHVAYTIAVHPGAGGAQSITGVPVAALSAIQAPSISGSGSAPITGVPVVAPSAIQAPSISGSGSAPITGTPVVAPAAIQAPTLSGSGSAPVTAVPALASAVMQAPSLSGSGSAPVTGVPATVVAVMVAATVATGGGPQTITGVAATVIALMQSPSLSGSGSATISAVPVTAPTAMQAPTLSGSGSAVIAAIAIVAIAVAQAGVISGSGSAPISGAPAVAVTGTAEIVAEPLPDSEGDCINAMTVAATPVMV